MPNALLRALQTQGSHLYSLQFLKTMLSLSLFYTPGDQVPWAPELPRAPLLERGCPSMGQDPPASKADATVDTASHTLSQLKHSQETIIGPGFSQHAPDRQAADPGCAPLAAPGAARLTATKEGTSLERAPSRRDLRFRPPSAANLLCDFGQVTAPLWVSVLLTGKMMPWVWLHGAFLECICICTRIFFSYVLELSRWFHPLA